MLCFPNIKESFLSMLKNIINMIFSTSDTRVSVYLKLIYRCKCYNLQKLALILSRKLQRNYGVFISHKAQFDCSLTLRHPIGIVIGEGVKIGENVTIFQNVTIGRSDTYINVYPDIGNNTIIYSGAVIVGNIKIGDNCIVGANAVVTKNIPDNSIAIGIPAKYFPRKS